MISLKWNGTRTAHPETERTWRSSWVYLFYYLWSRGDLAFIFLIKRPFISFFYAAVGTSLGSGRQIWEGRRELALTWKRQTDRWDTWVVWQLESATAEVSLPLLLHIFFQGAVENKYEEAWKQTGRNRMSYSTTADLLTGKNNRLGHFTVIASAQTCSITFYLYT